MYVAIQSVQYSTREDSMSSRTVTRQAHSQPGLIWRALEWPFGGTFSVAKLFGIMILITVAIGGLYQWRADQRFSFWTSITFAVIALVLYALAYYASRYLDDPDRRARIALEEYEAKVWDPERTPQ
jgi:hypothetical protein